MKQLVLLSGKGGTGKTSITAAFAHLAAMDSHNVPLVLADADVDAANLELLLAPRLQYEEVFIAGKTARIDESLCAGCGECVDACRFAAIEEDQGAYRVDPIQCEGCAACVYRCPSDAIKMEDQIAGNWYRSDSRYGTLFHAALLPGRENSGKLVTLVKQHARLLALDEGYPLVLVDGPPGIGCTVISAVSGADLALLIAEPTIAGVHDLRRVLETTNHFGVRSMVCINKADLYASGAEEIMRYCEEQGIEVLGMIPYDLSMVEALTAGVPVTEYRSHGVINKALVEIWNRVVTVILEHS
jgi:MinD superfamily P-loop ATPase